MNSFLNFQLAPAGSLPCYSADATFSRAWALLVAALVFLTAATPSVGQGLVAGQFNGVGTVSKNGGFQYELSIPLPLGIDGFQPQIRVTYDSQAGSGILGKGFQLIAAPSISRCPQGRRQDGRFVPVNLGLTDRFCFEGKRLVQEPTTSGQSKAYGSDGVTYRTELDEFLRVTSMVPVGGVLQRFLVETKSGVVHELGFTPDSRQMLAKAFESPSESAPAAVFSWHASRSKDRIGNEILYTYAADSDRGTHRLDRIEYNRGKVRVKFEYISDHMPRANYIGGGSLVADKILSRLTIYSDTDESPPVQKVVSFYKFNYTFADIKGDHASSAVARLTSISRCGSSESECLSPIAFEWALGTVTNKGFAPAIKPVNTNMFTASTGWAYEHATPRRLVDLNGDGVLDIVGFKNDGVYASLSQFGEILSFAAPKKVSSDYIWDNWREVNDQIFFPRHLIDMNRDGYPDIVGINSKYRHLGAVNAERGIWVSYWDPSGATFMPKQKIDGGDFFTNQGGNSTWEGDWGVGGDNTAPRYLVDFNADGYPDVIAFNTSGVWLSLWENGKLQAAKQVSTQLRMGGSGDGRLEDWLTADNMGVDRQPIFLQDMNADGFLDILGVNVNGTYLWTWNAANGTFNQAVLVTDKFKSAFRNSIYYPVNSVDMNGDGLPDLISFSDEGIKVALWNGKSLNPSAVWSSEFKYSSAVTLGDTPWRIVDINADGYPDIVVFSSSGVKVALSDGRSRFLQSSNWTAGFSSGGNDDGTGNEWGNSVKTPRFVVDMDGDGNVDIIGFGTTSIPVAKQMTAPGVRVVAVTDSLGDKTEVVYSVAQISSGNYQNDVPAAQFPLRDGHGPLHIVAEMRRDSGLAQQQVYRYQYEGRKFHFDDGALGFKRVTERELSTGLDRRSEYSQAHPFIGQLLVEETSKASGATVDVVKQGCTDLLSLCFRTESGAGGAGISRLTVRRFTYGAQDLAAAAESPADIGHKRKFVFLARQREEAWDLNGTPLPIRVVEDFFDEPVLVPGRQQFGNRTRRKTTLGADTFVTEVIDEYEAPDLPTWRLGLLSKRTVTSSRAAVSLAVAPATDAPPTPELAGRLPPRPMSPEMLTVILGILLDD